MRLPRVRVHVRRELPHPVERAYAWLTDFSDDDPTRTGGVVRRRRVLERSEGRVLLEEELELAGVVGRGVFEVRLDPPRWSAEMVRGAAKGSLHRYALTPSPGGCRLDVRYGIQPRRVRSLLRLLLARPRLRRELEAMWDGFIRAMGRELGEPPS